MSQKSIKAYKPQGNYDTQILIYYVNGALYGGSASGRILQDENGRYVFSSKMVNETLKDAIFLFEFNNETLHLFTSKIVYVSYNREWAYLVTTPECKIKVLAHSPEYQYGIYNQYVERSFMIPDPNDIILNQNSVVEYLPEINVPEFCDEALLDTSSGVLDFGNNVRLIKFQDIADKLSSGTITHFDFKTKYQVIHHHPLNYIASFYDTNGNIYLVNLKYNQSTNQIFPPN